ncbi:MAG: hypothetical protein QG583_578 [Patescibacteria group bacterium]|nr:hypothetical protein [Patescibacteria group bacterium]
MKPSEALTNKQYAESINLAKVALESAVNAPESKDLIIEIEISRKNVGEDTYKLFLTKDGVKKGKYWTFTMVGFYTDDTTTPMQEEEILTKDKLTEVVTFFDLEAIQIETLLQKLH